MVVNRSAKLLYRYIRKAHKNDQAALLKTAEDINSLDDKGDGLVESLALFNKVYTAAFRLTGQEATASDLALAALTAIAKEYDWQIRKPVPLGMLQASIKEVYRLFLAQPWPGKDPQPISKTCLASGQKEVLQAALLALGPLERATVVWRYITGFKVAELVPVAGETERDLYRYLSHALHELIRCLKLAGELKTFHAIGIS